MSAVDDAVEAGARALYEPGGFIHHRYCVDVPTGEVFCSCGWQASGPEAIAEYDEHEARVVIAAAWPILSAGLRELHARWDQGGGWVVCMHCNANTSPSRKKRWPCETITELDRIDRALCIGEGEAC